MYRFVAGLDLARQFYEDAVRPLVGELPHSAALIGPGSEVLGFDTARSTDHDWGPRLLLFLRPAGSRPRVNAKWPDGRKYTIVEEVAPGVFYYETT